MALQKQIHLHSVDTSFFYNNNESKIYKHLNKLYFHRNELKKMIKKSNDEQLQRINLHITKTNKMIKKLKDKMYIEFGKNNNIRILNADKLNKRSVVSIFESTLTRTMQIPNNTLTEYIFIIKTFFFDVIEDIILDGFIFKNEKYVCFTASAGQIRTKKVVFIKESELDKYEQSLMCGLTREFINKMGGVNINKYLAYLALCNSATDEWKSFDISKSIVIDDMETNVRGLVDFIDDKTYEITRKYMEVPITHTDGCGMILPRKSTKNFMVRLPWIKGLLISFPYDDFIKEYSGNSKIKDIYGKEWDIINDKIEIIFTKSQFKMWKYYTSWEQYCDNFIKFNCQAGKCNEEGSMSNEAKIGYQMLQTLTDMTDEELDILTKKTRNNIYNICKDRKTTLRLLGVTKHNTNKNYMQQAIEINPSLLMDSYNKNIIEQTKKSLVKEGKSAKIEIEAQYTFIAPDLYAFCEYIFLDKKNPEGLLQNGEVYCNIYRDIKKLDCLRSPHLFREHGVRNNIVDDNKSKWFITSALYTSCTDLISKVLQFDNDGDCSLVVADNIAVKIAERNMNDIVPLYYNMSKAGAVLLNNKMIYSGLKYAYTGGNIGIISNDITKIWNSNNINLDVIKLLCMENNFTIDYAKTLYKPERPKHIKKLITNYTKAKVPHFFIYAKDKKKNNVEPINNSVVNKISKMIKNSKVKIVVHGLSRFDYRILKKDSDTVIDNSIIELYEKLDIKKFYLMNNKKDIDNYLYIYQDIRNQILQLNSDIYYVVDVLVEYLYNIKNAKIKTTLWESFGDILVKNLKQNTNIRYTYCDRCGDLIKKTINNKRYCCECAIEINRQKTRKRKMNKNNGDINVK